MVTAVCSSTDFLTKMILDDLCAERKRTTRIIVRERVCRRILSTTSERSDAFVSVVVVHEAVYSLIVKVKSSRVWDVICSTLVLYRSTPGLDRGVGVFKGDYTQRQGWLYWRSFPVTLILYSNLPFTFQLNNSTIKQKFPSRLYI